MQQYALKIDGGYLWQPSSEGGWSPHYYVGADRVPSGYGCATITLPDLSVVRAERVSQRLDHYDDETGGPALSVEDYERESMRLRAPSVRTPDGEGGYDTSWPDLETEFAFRRFERRYRARYVDVREPVALEWSVGDYPRTSSHYIKAVLRMGGGKVEAFATYNRHECVRETAKAEMVRLGIKIEDRFERAAGEVNFFHSNEREVTVHGKDFSRTWPCAQMQGPLAECERVMAADVATVRADLEFYVGRGAQTVAWNAVAHDLRECARLLRESDYRGGKKGRELLKDAGRIVARLLALAEERPQ